MWEEGPPLGRFAVDLKPSSLQLGSDGLAHRLVIQVLAGWVTELDRNTIGVTRLCQ